MSGPDSTGESLESILASIRKSLSEQSTDVLEENATPPPDAQKEVGAPRNGLTQRLASTAADAAPPDAPQAEAALPNGHEVSNPVADQPPPAATPQPAATPSPATTSSGERKDPLWFLNRGGELAANESEQRSSADAPRPAAARTASDVVRGPLPPFFGSSAEAARVEVVPVQPIAPGAVIVRPQPDAAHAAARVPHGIDADGARGVRNGKAYSLFGPVAAEGKAAPEGDKSHNQALDIMISDLLRPMLRQWLEENMPRLVAAALKDEAARMSERDPNKP